MALFYQFSSVFAENYVDVYVSAMNIDPPSAFNFDQFGRQVYDRVLQ